MNAPAGLPLDGLVLIGSTTCPPCSQASAWLDANRVVYRKVAIDAGGKLDDELCAWIVASTKQQTVPQFFFDGHWIRGGLPEVQQMLAAGSLPTRPA